MGSPGLGQEEQEHEEEPSRKQSAWPAAALEPWQAMRNIPLPSPGPKPFTSSEAQPLQSGCTVTPRGQDQRAVTIPPSHQQGNTHPGSAQRRRLPACSLL